MKVENRKFYFIKDEFFDIFKGYKLMVNKENGNENENIIKYNYGLISKIIKILLVKWKTTSKRRFFFCRICQSNIN